mgnify:CR=1 FL=1
MSDWGAAVRHLLDLAADKFDAAGAAPAAIKVRSARAHRVRRKRVISSVRSGAPFVDLSAPFADPRLTRPTQV